MASHDLDIDDLGVSDDEVQFKGCEDDDAGSVSDSPSLGCVGSKFPANIRAQSKLASPNCGMAKQPQATRRTECVLDGEIILAARRKRNLAAR